MYKWTAANLDKWLRAPKEFAPETAMSVPGITNTKDRHDLIEYLKRAG